MMTLLFFFIALGVLIFVHEFGHFIVAKRQGIKVEVFSFGFGPRLFGFKKGDTDYRVSLLPLGGYVKMLGEDPTEPGAMDDPRSFAKKSVWQRTKVVLFGPVMNFILCLALMPIVFMIGRPEPVYLDQKPVVMEVRGGSPAAQAGIRKGDVIVSVDGSGVGSWEQVLNKILLSSSGTTLKIEVSRNDKISTVAPVIGQIPELAGGYLGIEPGLFYGNEAAVDDLTPGGPADKAGLKKGDKIASFNGAKVADWFDLTQKVNANKGAPAKISVLRDGVVQSFDISPEYQKEYDRWLIGIRKDRTSGVPMVTKRYGPIDAAVKGAGETWNLFKLTLDVLKRLVTFQLSYKVLGGPIVIAKTSAAAAATGVGAFIFFLAFLSMQLAVLNLLPIPVLDGGHLFFFAIEAVIRRPVSLKIREIATQVGFILLITLMLLVTINDINHVWGIKSLIDKIVH